MVFAASSLLLGYMAMNIKDLLKGKGPTAMFSNNPFERKRNWNRLIDQSGVLGIVGNIYETVSEPSNSRNFGPIYGTAGELVSDLYHNRNAQVKQDVLNSVPFNTNPIMYPVIHGVLASILADGQVELNDIMQAEESREFSRR